jgi:hypothetical protein
MGQADRLGDFVVGFLDEGGALIRIMPLEAESVTTATSRAGEIASEIAAADFYITSKPLFPWQTADMPGQLDPRTA